MWEQFIEHQDEWIGGTLIDCGDGDLIAAVVSPVPSEGARTAVVGFNLTSTYFGVNGQAFTCGGDRRYLHIVGGSRFGDGFQLGGYGGHEWHLIKPSEVAS